MINEAAATGWSEPVRTDLIATVRAELARAGDPERAAAQQRYMKSAMPFHGVPMAQVRAIARAAVASHPIPTAAQWQATIRALWDQAARREERYAASAVAGIGCSHPSAPRRRSGCTGTW